MKAQDVMTQDVEVVNPDTSLQDAARRMREEDVGSLPVGEGDELIGMITDRDIVINCVAEKQDLSNVTVREAMCSRVFYVFEDQSVDEVARNMKENQVRRLPVVNRDKRLVGIVSLGDLAAAGANGPASSAHSAIASAP